MNKVAKGISLGISLVGAGFLGYRLGREVTRDIRIKTRRKTEKNVKINQLLDFLNYYEEIWEEEGEKCKYIIKNNGANFIKIEKRGKHLNQSVMEEDELLDFIYHLEETVWTQGCPFTKKDSEKKSYGRCKFYNDIELYVNPFYFFKGTDSEYCFK